MSQTPAVRSLSCPNCGAAVQIRGMAHTLSAVCIQCLSIIDVKDPNLRIIQQFQEAQRVTPLIPLGTRGKLHGDPYEAIGFQERSITVDDTRYAWREYVLFNPYKGFRYLTEYDGHWNDVKPLTITPPQTPVGGQPGLDYLGRKFRHFQTASATTDFVMGEFPWRVQVGERVSTSDFVSPPLMLSQERTEDEVTWSLGEYMDGARVWQAFQLEGSPPPARGIYANQPSPYQGRVFGVWKRWALLAGALLLLMLATQIIARKEVAFESQYILFIGTKENQAFVTPVFDIKGRESSVEVEIRTQLNNNWAYFNLALINEQTGYAYDFGREVSYYTDSEGSEGSRNDSAIIPAVPAGRYYLRVEPETDEHPSFSGYVSVPYEIRVRRDVPEWLWFLPAFVVLLIPPIIVTIRSGSFESQRWQESDHASGSDDGDSDDE